MKQYEESIAKYHTILQTHPDHRVARISLARTLAWSGRFEESIQEYRKVKTLPAESKVTDGDIANWTIRWALATALSYVKRYDESLHEYKNFVRKSRAFMRRRLKWQRCCSGREIETIPSGY